MIHVYTGEGKGKTSAAFGIASRHAYYSNNKVLIVQFMKEWFSGEVESAKKLGIQVERFGKGFFFGEDFELHRKAMLEGIDFIKKNKHDYSMIVMDEVNVILDQKLLSFKELEDVFDDKREFVLTGRNAPSELTDKADYVTYFKNIKHPFEKGVYAREGVEY